MVELRQQLGFVDEALHAGVEGFAVPLGARLDVGRAGAIGQRGRHVLLERDLAVERMVPGEVDDAEAAFADRLGDLEFAEPRARLEGQRMVRAAGGDRDGGAVVGTEVGTEVAAEVIGIACVGG